MNAYVSRIVMAVLLLGLAIAAPAWALQNPQPSHRQPPGPDVTGSFTAQATGIVTSVDQTSGKLTLQTLDGPLTVTFPPTAVQNVEQGDQVTVAIGLVENSPSASPSSPASTDAQNGSTKRF